MPGRLSRAPAVLRRARARLALAAAAGRLSRLRPPFARTLLLAATGAALAGGVLAVRAAWPGGRPPGSLVAELGALRLPRALLPRVSVSQAYVPCRERAGDDVRMDVRCGAAAPDGPGLRSLAARVAALGAEGARADAVHAAGLLDLLWSDGDGKILDRAILTLQRAAELADAPAAALADLAAALLVRAERGGDPRDLTAAAEAAAEAVERDGRMTAGWFNLALALERLAADGEAARAWERYAMLDSASGWGAEARRRRDGARARMAAVPPTVPAGADDPALRAFAAAHPQEAREEGWARFLGAWGEAVLRGDTAAAARSLHVAETLGAALAARPGGDASLADAVAAIRRAGAAEDAAGLRDLAAGHAGFAEAAGAMFQLRGEEADSLLQRVLAAPAHSAALRDAAAVMRGGALLMRNRRRDARTLLDAYLRRADIHRHRAVAARAQATLATVHLRTGEARRAEAAAEGAAEQFSSAGETENAAGARYVASQARANAGDVRGATLAQHRARTSLRARTWSVWRANVLAASASLAASEGLHRTALRFQDERVEAVLRTGVATLRVEALAARGAARLAQGDTAGARRDVDSASTAAATLPPGTTSAWVRADLRTTRAALALGDDPARAAMLMDSVVRDSGGITAIRRFRTRIRRAEARAAANDIAGAAADLAVVAAQVTGERSATRDSVRGGLRGGDDGDAVTRIHERLALLQLARGDTLGALATVEEGRSALRRQRGRRDHLSAVWPTGAETGVQIVLAGDTLLVWAIRPGRASLVRRTVDAALLLRTIDRVRTELELGREPRAELAALHAMLLEPVRTSLGTRGTGVLLAVDPELDAVPFAALYDGLRRSFLVEDHPLRFTPSLTEGMVRLRPYPPDSVLLVADPAFSPRSRPGLDRLTAARGEAAAIAAAYEHHRSIADTAARVARVLAAFPRWPVVHVSAHGAFLERDPQRSYLVMADDATLTASDLDTLDLRRTRLVVLSACATLRVRGSRGAGFGGFAGALLGAGAGGVVGSLWRVDDRATADLMTRFHRSYRIGGDPAAALREAQLAQLRSPDPALRSPAAWAGFRYMGR